MFVKFTKSEREALVDMIEASLQLMHDYGEGDETEPSLQLSVLCELNRKLELGMDLSGVARDLEERFGKD